MKTLAINKITCTACNSYTVVTMLFGPQGERARYNRSRKDQLFLSGNVKGLFAYAPLHIRYIVGVFSLISMLLTSASAKPTITKTRQPLTVKHGQLQSLTPSQLARLTLPSIVRLTVVDKQGQPNILGSGVVVGTNLIVTNMHVIQNAHAVTANFENGRSETVYGMVAEDAKSDLALLYADTSGVRPLPLALGNDAQIGDPVVTVGSPEGLGGSISTGIISGFRHDGAAQVIQTTAPTSHGSSGGALLDMYGRVLGITSFTNPDGQNLNFAYASRYVQQLLPRKLITYITWLDLEAFAQVIKDETYTAQQLSGLKGVAVVVTDVGEDAKKDGLDMDKLKANIESGLRKNNITVYDNLTTTENASQAELFLYITMSKDSTGSSYVYSVSFSLIENVEVQRSVPTYTRAFTWYNYSQGIISSTIMAQSIYDLINKMVDAFSKDYQDGNPK